MVVQDVGNICGGDDFTGIGGAGYGLISSSIGHFGGVAYDLLSGA